jgi:hypothetical protein
MSTTTFTDPSDTAWRRAFSYHAVSRMNPSNSPILYADPSFGVAAEPLRPQLLRATQGDIIGIGQKEYGVYQEVHAQREIDSGECYLAFTTTM